jgi:hypothetical protein
VKKESTRGDTQSVGVKVANNNNCCVPVNMGSSRRVAAPGMSTNVKLLLPFKVKMLIFLSLAVLIANCLVMSTAASGDFVDSGHLVWTTIGVTARSKFHLFLKEIFKKIDLKIFF